jgi:phosphinothricin acetyltransferase
MQSIGRVPSGFISIENIDANYSFDCVEAYLKHDYRRRMIRMARAEDAEAIANIYRPIVASTAISFELVPPSVEEIKQRILTNLQFAPWLVSTGSQDEALGYAYASKHRERLAYQWSVDVAIYVDPEQRRRGIGRALYTSLAALLRLQGFYAAHAGITLPNSASVALHESLGFRPVGVYRAVGYKLGAWHDVGWWQLSLRERAGEPATPHSVEEAQRDPGWNGALRAGAREGTRDR